MALRVSRSSSRRIRRGARAPIIIAPSRPGMECAAGYALAIVVIDDGSTDGTAVRAQKLGLEVVRLPFNLGIGGAMQTGYQYARDHGFQLAIQVDGDGQHDPGEIAALIEPVVSGEADMAVG